MTDEQFNDMKAAAAEIVERLVKVISDTYHVAPSVARSAIHSAVLES